MHSVSFISSLVINLSFLIRPSGAIPVSLGNHCSSGEFECSSDGVCISADRVCDSSYNCRDKSDEVGCLEETTTNIVSVECAEDQFMCRSDRYCIKQDWVCDNAVDCADNSDELDCFSVECEEQEVRCKDTGHCIKMEWICDGKGDCIDKTDEENCPSTTAAATSTEPGKMEETITEFPPHPTEASLEDSLPSEASDLNFVASDPPTTTFPPSFSSENDDLHTTKDVAFQSSAELDQSTHTVTEANVHTITERNNSYYDESIDQHQDSDFLTEATFNFDKNATGTIVGEAFESSESSKNLSLRSNEEQNVSIPALSFNSTDEFLLDSTTPLMYQLEDTFDAEEILDYPQFAFINMSFISYETTFDTPSATDIGEYTFPTIVAINQSFVASSTMQQTTSSSTSTATSTTPTTTLTTTPTTTTTTTTPTTTTTTTTPTTTTPTTTTTTTTPENPCRRDEFHCVTEGICIPVEWRCDHTSDCWDGSDEENCSQVDCPSDMVKCVDTGQCIFHAWICDGAFDCDSGSDEMNCK